MLATIGAIASSFVGLLKLYTAGVQNVAWSTVVNAYATVTFDSSFITMMAQGSGSGQDKDSNSCSLSSALVDLSGKTKVYVDFGYTLLNTSASTGFGISCGGVSLMQVWGTGATVGRSTMTFPISGVANSSVGFTAQGYSGSATLTIYNVWAE